MTHKEAETVSNAITIEGMVVIAAAARASIDGESWSANLGLCPWRAEGRVRWKEFRVVLPVRPMEQALEERRRYPHCVVVRAVVSSEDLDRGYSNAIGPVEIIAATAAEAGFPEQAPPMAELPAVLAHANFSPGFDTLFATVRIGTADVEVLLDLVGSTERGLRCGRRSPST